MRILYSDLASRAKLGSLEKKLFLDACRTARAKGFYREAGSFARPNMLHEDMVRNSADVLLFEAPIFLHQDQVFLYPTDVQTNLKISIQGAVKQLTEHAEAFGAFILRTKSEEASTVLDILKNQEIPDRLSVLLVTDHGIKSFRRFGLPLHTLLTLKLIELSPDSKTFMSSLSHSFFGLDVFFPEFYSAHLPPSFRTRPSIVSSGLLSNIPTEFTLEIEGDTLGDVQDDIQEIAHYVQNEEDPLVQAEATLALIGAKYQHRFLDKLNVRKLVEGTMSLKVPDYQAACPLEALDDFQISTVLIPEGETKIGIDSDEYPAEGPEHKVSLLTFEIGKLPVTRHQFKQFLQHSGHDFDTSRWQDVNFSDEEVPANFVTLGDALSFCRWATTIMIRNGSLNTGKYITLPSEIQWERTARGRKQSLYPWGSEFDASKCNCKATGINSITSSLEFSEGQSDEGVFDLIGNVHEWTRSLWGFGNREPDFGYPYDDADGREKAVSNGRMRYVVRGGAFYYEANCLNSFARNYKFPNLGQVGSGFRICIQER